MKTRVEKYFDDGDNAPKRTKKNNELYEAIESYSKVIETDVDNYKYAKKYIDNNKNILKSNTMTEVDNLIENKDYVNAKAKLDLLQKIFKDDNNINQKILLIKDEAKKQETEN